MTGKLSRPATVDVITLGCSKNLVDSERLLKMFEHSGIVARHNPEHGASSIVVINTCGFISDAKEESIDTIMSYINLKNNGKVQKIYVMGCLSERYKEQLVAEIPEVDGFFGKFDWQSVLAQISKEAEVLSADQRSVTTGPANAYVKIAEGCNRFCAFCAIPLITGRFKSRPVEEIVREIENLVAQGISEFNIIAQDLSSYGRDIYGGQSRLAYLIDTIANIDGVKWVRLHYAYPADFPEDILDVIRDNPRVCKYLDIALQHISDNVLKNMRRHITAKETRALLSKIRERVPGIHLRTTLMVGFPGEGEKEFEELMEFVKEARFERMGAFTYCEEDDTYAASNFDDDIPQEVKDKRLDRLMALQEEISREIQEEKLGKIIEVVIDREEDDYYVGRTQFDSPEVDPEVLVSKIKKLIPGQYYNVEITDALPFELIGRPL